MTKQRPSYRPLISFFLDILGIIGVIWGFHLIYAPLGWILGGIGLFVVALAIDPPVRKTQPKRVSEVDG